MVPTGPGAAPASVGVFLGKLWARGEGTSRAHWQLTQKRTWWGGRPRPRTEPRRQVTNTLCCPPIHLSQVLAPPGERMDLSGQHLSLAPAISRLPRQIQSTQVPKDKCTMCTKGKVKLIPLATNHHGHLSYPQILILLPYCLNSKDRSVTLPPP